MGSADSIPVISQVKSLVQVMSGDVEGARKTQEFFQDTAPMVSHVTSLVHVIDGNTNQARETHERFANGLPIARRVKRGENYIKGDNGRGEGPVKGEHGGLVSSAGGAVGSVAGSNGAEFVTSHQRLPGSVSEVLTANWQHLSAPQTVSSLVTLFVILRLILWDDKKGRNYSRELCSFTIEPDYIERCQESLMKTLRSVEDNFASQNDDSTFVLNPDFVISSSITNGSTRLMIQTTATLYGILGSMGRGREAGVKWLMELCMYEDLGSYRICEEEVIHKLQDLNHKAFDSVEARKQRIRRGATKRMCPIPSTPASKRAKYDVYAIPKLNTNNFTSITSIDVGTHEYVQQVRNQAKNQGLPLKSKKRFESNHVPACSAYGEKYCKDWRFINSLPAHSLPKKIHQFAMRKVGTSKSSTVAKTLRDYESKLIRLKRMPEAIKLDLIASYGRANVLMDVNGNTQQFRPALVEYRKDLHAVINEHLLQNRISSQDATDLHDYMETQVQYWGSQKPTWDTWFNRMESEYQGIVQQNGLKVADGITVPTAKRQYG